MIARSVPGSAGPIGPGQLDDERRALPWPRSELQPSTHALGQLAGDVEAETGSAGPPKRQPADAVELLEDPLPVVPRHAGASIGHGDPDAPIHVLRGDLDGGRA